MSDEKTLARLRYLVCELAELIAEPEFDVFTFRDILNAIREIEKLRREAGLAEILRVDEETSRVRVISRRPSGRAVYSGMVYRPQGRLDNLAAPVWSVLRRPEILANLKRWQRHIGFEIAEKGGASEDGNPVWSKPLTIQEIAKQLDRSPRQVKRYIDSGTIRVKPLGRSTYLVDERDLPAM